MGGEAAERDHLGPDGDGRSQDLDTRGAVDDLPPERSAGHEADREKRDATPPEVVLEVVDDAAAVTHAGTGDDHAGIVHVVESP